MSSPIVFDTMIKVDGTYEIIDLRACNGFNMDENFLLVNQEINGLQVIHSFPLSSVLYVRTITPMEPKKTTVASPDAVNKMVPKVSNVTSLRKPK